MSELKGGKSDAVEMECDNSTSDSILSNSANKNHTKENYKLQLHGSIKSLKFSCLRTRNSLKLHLDQLGSAAYRCWRLTYLNWERDKRERIAYQNGVFGRNSAKILCFKKRMTRKFPLC